MGKLPVKAMWTMPVRVDRWMAKKVRLNGECWEWIGSKTGNGYGQVGLSGRLFMAHRAFYEYFIAEIPSGLDLDHLCRNRACVNPWHLEPVTRSVNLFRAGMTRPHNGAKTHCPQGHPYDSANTAIRHGSRTCRSCERARSARQRSKKRETCRV